MAAKKACDNHLLTNDIRRSNRRATTQKRDDDLLVDSDRDPSPSSSASWSSSGTSPSLSIEFECAVCYKSFDTNAALKEHISASAECGSQTFKAFLYKCEQCGKGFPHQSHLDRHKLSHSSRKSFKCKKCDKRYSRADRLAVHVRRKHSKKPPKKRFKCEECGLRFEWLINLTRHRSAVHMLLRDHQCDKCNLSFAQKSNLKEHQKILHPEAVPMESAVATTFECLICSKIFTRRHNMTVHVQTVHEGIKEYGCPSCPKIYGSKTALDKHKATQHGVVPAGRNVEHQCPVCKKKFSQKSNLSVHQQIHDTERKLFECHDCKKSYTRKAALLKHSCESNSAA